MLVAQYLTSRSSLIASATDSLAKRSGSSLSGIGPIDHNEQLLQAFEPLGGHAAI